MRSPRNAAGIWPGDEGRRGAVAVLLALMLIAIIGFVSLGTEVVLLLLISRQMQSAADAGALAAVSARLRGYPSDYTQEAFALAAAAGFADGQNGTTVIVTYISASDAVEVVIAQPQTLALANVVHSGAFTVRARALAHIKSDSGACVLVLDNAASGALSMNGISSANFVGCDVRVNSSSRNAVSLVGGAILNADHLYVAGGYNTAGGSQLNAAMIETQAPTTADPYAGTTMPPAGACRQTNYNPPANATISPGTYCDGITVRAGVSLTFNPGTYIINRGSLSLNGGASLTGTGVTIVLTGSGTNYANVSIQGGATVNLTAPSSGATAGLVFFQDRNAKSTGPNSTDSFGGGAGQSITGALYFPNQTVQFGGSATSNNTCTEIVALQLILVGNQTMQVACAGTGVTRIGGQPELIE